MDLIIDRSYRAAADVTRLHAKSFYFASVALPHTKKRRAFALYSFCRYLDDRVDRANSPAAMDEAMLELEDFVERVASGSGTIAGERRRLPWVDAFLHTTEVCGIPVQFYRDLLHGVRLDRSEVELADWPALKSYCYYVAGVVGLMMTRIFEMEDRTQDARAIELGEAMQLTNILRDVAEDLRLGRVYLPKDELARYGLDRSFLSQGRITPEWRDFMRFQVERARAAYTASEPGIRALPRDGSQRTVWLMRTLYAGILDAVEAADFDVFSTRRHVPFSRKLQLAARVWFRG